MTRMMVLSWLLTLGEDGSCPLLAHHIVNEGGFVADYRPSLVIGCCSASVAAAVEEDDGAPATNYCSADGDGGFANLSCRMEGTMLDLSSAPAGSSSTPVFTITRDERGMCHRRCCVAVGPR
ncbi:hypothetical protein ACLOJK_027342 [Asimina triloba]